MRLSPRRLPGVNLLDRYIMRHFVLGLLPVMLLLLILFSFLALAEELEAVGEGVFTQMDAFAVVLYTAPRRMVDLLPVTALLGGLIGMGALANHQELIAARVAGMSRPRLTRPVLIVTVFLALCAMGLQSFVIPAMEREANELRARTLMETQVDQGGKLEFWTRSGDRFVRVNEVRYGRLLADIEVYSTDAEGRLQRMVQAQQASISGVDNWLLQDVIVTTIDGLVTHEEQREELLWPGLLSASQAAILVLPLEALAPLDLARLIEFQQRNGLDTHRLRVVFWQQVSIAVAVIGMGLLSLPLLLGSIRSIPAGQRVVIGGFVGMVFYLLQQLTGHLAGLFNLHPPTTILMPALVLLVASVYAQFVDHERRRRARRRAARRLRRGLA